MKFHTNTKPVPQNQKLKRGANKQVYLSKPFRDTWNAIYLEWLNQYNKKEYIAFTSDTPLEVNIEFSWNRYDVDSLIKPILDILHGIASTNDKQVVKVTCEKMVSNEHRLIVYIKKYV